MAISRELRNLLKNPKRCRLTNLYKFLTNSEKNIINSIIDEFIERNPIRKYNYKEPKVKEKGIVEKMSRELTEDEKYDYYDPADDMSLRVNNQKRSDCDGN